MASLLLRRLLRRTFRIRKCSSTFPGTAPSCRPRSASQVGLLILGPLPGTGVATVHVWAFPTTGAAPIFLGAANMGVQRPDIAAYFGNPALASAGFGLSAFLPPGTYDITAYAFSTVANAFNHQHSSRVTVVQPISVPRMYIRLAGAESGCHADFHNRWLGGRCRGTFGLRRCCRSCVGLSAERCRANLRRCRKCRRLPAGRRRRLRA